jgi:hypothetical protein
MLLRQARPGITLSRLLLEQLRSGTPQLLPGGVPTFNFLTRTGVAQVHLSQNGPGAGWRRPPATCSEAASAEACACCCARRAASCCRRCSAAPRALLASSSSKAADALASASALPRARAAASLAVNAASVEAAALAAASHSVALAASSSLSDTALRCAWASFFSVPTPRRKHQHRYLKNVGKSQPVQMSGHANYDAKMARERWPSTADSCCWAAFAPRSSSAALLAAAFAALSLLAAASVAASTSRALAARAASRSPSRDATCTHARRGGGQRWQHRVP